jgi:cytochrome c oxidase subunit III
MSRHFVTDVRRLPNHAFGPDSILWWGTLGFVAIETVGFALGITSYFFLMREVPDWPPGEIDPPNLLLPSIFTGLVLASVIPNLWVKRASEEQRLRPVLIGMALMVVIGTILLTLRGLEFSTLNVRWDTNAYGSIVWVLLGLHTLHLATDVVDTAVLLALLVCGHVEPRRFTDAAENAEYWNFVVIAWLPLYAVLDLVPRFT